MSSESSKSSLGSEASTIDSTEVEIETESRAQLAVGADNDEDLVQPYEGEPIADEEWITSYKARKIAQQEHHDALQSRIDGSQVLDTWY